MKSEIINIDEIEEIIIAFANGELSRRMEISDERGDRDTIVAGINMLGEELEKTTVSRDYFMNIYNSVSEILIIADLNGKIIDINLAAEKTLNKTLYDLKDVNLKTIINERFLYLENLIENGVNFKKDSIPFEASLVIDPHQEIPVSCTISKILDRFNVHSSYLFIAKDITERKEKERNDLKIAISTQEKERKRLAYDLHDSLGQELNAIKMYLNSLTQMNTSTENFKIAFEECKNIIDNSIDTIRTISFDLMPNSLEQGGLIEALKELVNRLKNVFNIEYNFPEIVLKISNESQINIYRIIQEFITNSIKHSQAKIITIDISRKNKIIQISVKDNGVGFDFKNTKYGYGIFNMKARMKASGIKYQFESDLNKGTYLRLFIEQK